MQTQNFHSLTANFHFAQGCNMKCGHCFVAETKNLSVLDYLYTLEKLTPYFTRVNFVGGEPTASPYLVPLVKRAYALGLDCTMVTNGFNLIHQPEKFSELYPLFSCIGISVDALDEGTNWRIGRCCGNQVITRAEYESLCKTIKAHGIRLKLNTVVSRLNLREDFTDFYAQVKPDRIKLLQVLKPNDTLRHNYDDLLISKAEFDTFVRRHNKTGLNIVAEDNAAMTNAYYIIDSECRFFDNRTGKRSPSLARTNITVEDALSCITVDEKKYQARYCA